MLDVYIKGYLSKVKSVLVRAWRYGMMEDRLGAAMLVLKYGTVFDYSLTPDQANGMDYLHRKGFVDWSIKKDERYWFIAESNMKVRGFVQKESSKLGRRVSSDCVEVY